MNIYLAGPMAGYEQMNYPAFADAAAKLRALGLEVESPHEIDDRFPNRAVYNNPDEEWLFYMLVCIPMVFKANAIIMLPGWERSKGACIERQIAQERGIPIFRYGSLELNRALSLLALATNA